MCSRLDQLRILFYVKRKRRFSLVKLTSLLVLSFCLSFVSMLFFEQQEKMRFSHMHAPYCSALTFLGLVFGPTLHLESTVAFFLN